MGSVYTEGTDKGVLLTAKEKRTKAFVVMMIFGLIFIIACVIMLTAFFNDIKTGEKNDLGQAVADVTLLSLLLIFYLISLAFALITIISGIVACTSKKRSFKITSIVILSLTIVLAAFVPFSLFLIR